jgi:uncharacterized protein (DUF952 family)
MDSILHITSRGDWEAAVAGGEYSPLSLQREGFIHCSTLPQLAAVANAFFQGQSGLVLLLIDPMRVNAEIRWERAEDLGQTFPHIYGPLNLDAVNEVLPFEPSSPNSFGQDLD